MFPRTTIFGIKIPQTDTIYCVDSYFFHFPDLLHTKLSWRQCDTARSTRLLLEAEHGPSLPVCLSPDPHIQHVYG